MNLDGTLLRQRLPANLSSLPELALDLRWTWSHGGDALFRAIDAGAWETTHNPWLIIQSTAESRFDELARDADFCDELDRLVAERASYHAAVPAKPLAGTIAFFCMEFGLGTALPLYAGGLGILAGDYLKTASDLRLPLVGVGILYQEGYFRQSIDADGRQHEAYPYNDPSTLPIQPALAPDGSWARAEIGLPGRRLHLRIWRARVGRVDLFLLDANDPENGPVDRGITAKLYPADPELRLLQELVLGLGGPRALEAVGVDFAVAHLNEGHAAFAVLERARVFAVRNRVTFAEALAATRASNLFTTHTPAPAGFDVFSPELVGRYFGPSGALSAVSGFSLDALLALGRVSESATEPFSMAYLALRGCAHVNGVSRLHGEVSRHLFANAFPRWPESEVPIGHVTNGVHIPSWDSPAADALWTTSCGKARWLGSVEGLSNAMAALSDEALWNLRAQERRDFVERVRRRVGFQARRRGDGATADSAGKMLDANVLTLGFARRFATYKRPTLLLTDPDRLSRLLCNPELPVQLVLAGKAHPADEKGKAMITAWHRFLQRPEIRDRAAFLEDYDMTVGEEMVRGVDVWLNTPRRPWEACGTSGMKVLVNGGLNLSELDGWWEEAASPEVGWTLGGSENRSDEEDALSLYSLLEDQIVKEFYDRDSNGVPRAWVQRIRNSISHLTPLFSSNRMLAEYVTRYYEPAVTAYGRRTANHGAIASEICRWAAWLEGHWPQIRFGEPAIEEIETGLVYRIPVYLGEVPTTDVTVELCAEAGGEHDAFRAEMTCDGVLSGALNGHVYELRVDTCRPANDFTVRVVPKHPDALVPAELALIAWQR